MIAREALRVRHYSIRTEEAYLHWVRRYILFHSKRHPAEMGEAEIETFLTYLAVERQVAASTQNQALSAILFLYKQVLGRDLDWLENVTRAKQRIRLPVVLTREEVQRMLARINGVCGLAVRLMYGTGMRVMEALRVCAKDVDFGYRKITVREGKGNKDRVVPLPEALAIPLARHTWNSRERRTMSTWRKVLARGIYLMHWRESIPMCLVSGVGSMSLRQPHAAAIPGVVKFVAIIYMSRMFSARCARRRAMPES